MKDINANILICGAGIAGIAAAYYLAEHGIDGILLVDQGAPLSLTSDKSTEAYRNWWPGPDDAMIQLMTRSIDLIEGFADATNNSFHLNRRGYLYATTDAARAAEFKVIAKRAEAQGAGPLRVHLGESEDPAYISHNAEGYSDQPTGSDLILDPALMQRHFPYLSSDILALLHTRRCGWFSAQQFGMFLFEKSLQAGVRYVNAQVEGIGLVNDHVDQVHLRQDGSPVKVACRTFVNAAGPHIQQVAGMLDIELPVYFERHLKVSIKDHEEVIPRDAPLLIWNDPQQIPWEEEERQLLSGSDAEHLLLGELPFGAHARPEGSVESQSILMLWPYHLEPVEPVFPVPLPAAYPEVTLRGLLAMIPELKTYLNKMPKPFIDGGYYTKTLENRPLVGPLPVKGAFLLGALSGFGLMAACGAAELLAAHITQASLPAYAQAFMLERYQDPGYLPVFEEWGYTNQL